MSFLQEFIKAAGPAIGGKAAWYAECLEAHERLMPIYRELDTEELRQIIDSNEQLIEAKQFVAREALRERGVLG